MICRRFEPTIEDSFLPDYVTKITNDSLRLPKGVKIWRGESGRNYWLYEPLPGYLTCDAAFAEELLNAGLILLRHFQEAKPSRPLNCLIIGPPGSGKTVLAKQLGKFLEQGLDSSDAPIRKNDLSFLEFNVADFTSPADVIAMLEEIRRQGQKKRLIVFVDEFDVTIGGTSVIRHLINPIYSGKYTTKAGTEESLGRVAFIFSGSYIRSKHYLRVLQHDTSKFDLPRLLADVSSIRFSANDIAAQEVKVLSDTIIVSQLTRTLQADGDVYAYLSKLDKLQDFISRINGFIVEIPDVSDPLNTTRDPLAATDNFVPDELYCRWRDGEAVDSLKENIIRANVFRARNQAVAERMRDFILAHQRLSNGGDIQAFKKPWVPARVYKCMLILDRLVRVVRLLKMRFEDANEVRIERHILHFLVTIPLVHGSRSLEFLVGLLEMDEGPVNRLLLTNEKLMSPGFSRHARPVYGPPEQFWRRFCQTNRIDPSKHPGDGLINISLS